MHVYLLYFDSAQADCTATLDKRVFSTSQAQVRHTALLPGLLQEQTYRDASPQKNVGRLLWRDKSSWAEHRHSTYAADLLNEGFPLPKNIRKTLKRWQLPSRWLLLYFFHFISRKKILYKPKRSRSRLSRGYNVRSRTRSMEGKRVKNGELARTFMINTHWNFILYGMCLYTVQQLFILFFPQEKVFFSL